MSNTTAQTTTYGAIITQLKEISANMREKVNKPDRPTDRVYWFREYCTITVGGPRQSGKTETLIQMVEKDDMVITYNLASKELFEERYVNRMLKQGLKINEIFLNINTAFGLGLEIKNTERYVLTVSIDPTLSREEATNILIQHMEQAKERLEASDPNRKKMYKRFFVDDAHYLFDGTLSVKKFYKWVVEHTEEPNPLIVLMG